MDSDNKYERMQAAYHVQQAIEKTIKLKARIKTGTELWGHNIKMLIQKCEEEGIAIDVPSVIKKKATMYSNWEAQCRYKPSKIVRRDSINTAYNECYKWLQSGDTSIKQRNNKKKGDGK